MVSQHGVITITPDLQTWTNAGTLYTDRGSLTVDFGQPWISSYNGPQTIDNTGLIEAGSRGDLSLDAPVMFPGYCSGLVENSGVILANGGMVTLDAPVQQTATGRIEIANNGTVDLSDVEGTCLSGGVIQITSGMLDMAVPPMPGTVVSSKMQLLGSSAKLDFTGGLKVGFTFNAATQDLQVFRPAEPALDFPKTVFANFQIADHMHAVAADFSLHGSDLVFCSNPHPPA